MTSVVAASRVFKELGGRSILRGVSLDIARGEAFGLLGPNGAGKTTTVRVLTGLLRPEEGRVELFGEDIALRPVADYLGRIGVQTDTQLYGNLSVLQNLRIWAELFEVPASLGTRRIDDLLALFRLTDWADRPVNALSKGMRQKLSVARALVNAPELLFLDEPTAGLDPEAAAELTGYLRTLLDGGDTTVVICTHQLLGLELLCDTVGILKDGVLQVQGNVEALIAARWPSPRYLLGITAWPDSVAAVASGEGGDAAAGALAVGALAGVVGPGVEVRAIESALVELTLTASAGIEGVVRSLVTAGFEVNRVSPVEHTIQDLYFDTVGG